MWGAIAAAAIPAIASIMGQGDANKTNETIANNANRLQESLADTSFQRRVKDLSAAGLNPMLAYSQGGAAVPQMNVSRSENTFGAGASAAANAGLQSLLVKSQIETQKSQQDLNAALSSKAVADANLSSASAGEVAARTPIYQPQIQEIMARIDQAASQTNLNFAQTTLVKRQAVNAILHGQQIVADTGNKEADTLLKNVERWYKHGQARMSEVSANAAESPLGRYVMPFMPFVTGTAAAAK